MLGERYSYEQIARALARRGVHLSASEIGKWCRRQGLRSVVSSRHQPSADKKSAPAQAPAPAATPAPIPAPKSISELLAEDAAAQAATLGKFFRSNT
jgi:IS30 family transposase